MKWFRLRVLLDANFTPAKKFRLLYSLRHISNLLHEASERLNGLFPMSIMCCNTLDVIHLVGAKYFTIEAGVRTGHWLSSFTTFAVNLSRGNSMLAMTNACEYAAVEVCVDWPPE